MGHVQVGAGLPGERLVSRARPGLSIPTALVTGHVRGRVGPCPWWEDGKGQPFISLRGSAAPSGCVGGTPAQLPGRVGGRSPGMVREPDASERGAVSAEGSASFLGRTLGTVQSEALSAGFVPSGG